MGLRFKVTINRFKKNLSRPARNERDRRFNCSTPSTPFLRRGLGQSAVLFRQTVFRFHLSWLASPVYGTAIVVSKMNSMTESRARNVSDTSKCLARSVVDTLSAEPALEAITINRARQTISLATLGKTDEPRLAENVTDRIRKAYQTGLGEHCQLLQGVGACQTCHAPLSEQERRRITIEHEGDKTTIARVTCPTAPAFWRWRDIPWPKVVQRDVEYFEAKEHPGEWKWQLLCTVLCAMFGLTAHFLPPHGTRPAPVGLIFYGLAYVTGAWFAAEEVWHRLRKATLDVHFLMLAVAAGAAAVNEWNEGTLLLFLFSLSGALEHYAMDRTRREIHSLFKSAPKTAILIDSDGREEEVPVANLRSGMKLLIKPDAQFPVDAEITKGASASDESNLTGEATPVEKNIGDAVLAGTLNLWGAVEVTVMRPAAESALQKIIHLIQDAQRQKAPAQRVIDRFSSVYTYSILGLTLVMFFVWWLAFKLSPFAVTATQTSAFYRAMTLLVVASPCALVLSIPSAVLAAIAWGARHGILFRGGAAVEKLADAQIVALDKTGTLTTGELRVEQVQSFPPGREKEVAQLAYSLERLSTHPLARAITRYGKQQQLSAIEFSHFESITGKGLRARHNGGEIYLGRRDPLAKGPHAQALTHVPHTEPGVSEVWISTGGLLGRLLLRDDIRPQAKAVLEEMHAAGLISVVLTGDRKAAAEHLRTQLPVDDIRAELRPEDKVAAIRSLGMAGKRVVMVGDGVNDAPSLAAAYVGVAMGARGADAALEQAEVVLMHDRLENFLAAFRLSQRARRIIRQNQVLSLGTVVMLVSFAMAGHIPLTVGVIGHEGSTVVVVMNSLRLLFGTGPKSP
jgi:Cd2+/Zn2+-exporting ATPase